jgi:hypothetical protein
MNIAAGMIRADGASGNLPALANVTTVEQESFF